MNRSVFKPILAGLIIGAAAFFMPFFVLKILLFLLVAGAIWRLFSWRSWHYRQNYYYALADKIRSMSEEEYKEMKNKTRPWDHHCCGYSGHCGYPGQERTENKNP